MTEETKATGKQAEQGKQANPPKPPVDWERIRAMYRANVLSVREVAVANGVSHTAIQKKVKANPEGWARDLSKRIAERADELVAKREVASQVASARAEQKVATDKAIIDGNAEVIATVRMNHRGDIRRFRAMVVRMLSELEHQAEFGDLYHELADALEAKDKDGNPTGTDKLNDIYRRVIGMPQRVDSLKKLAETLKILIALEREAFNIGPVTDDSSARDDAPALSAQDAYMRMIGK